MEIFGYSVLVGNYDGCNDNIFDTFSNAAETELFLEILSTRDGSRIGSKRFYNTPTGTLNIAPMVRKNIRFVPSSGMTGFCNSESRSASVQLAVGFR